jgi:hypothetical protein
MKKTDLEIFAEWHEKSLGKYIITENAQAGAIIEFAKYYYKKRQKQLLLDFVQINNFFSLEDEKNAKGIINTFFNHYND